MFIKTESKKDFLIVRLRGELDMDAVSKFRNRVIELMEEKKLNNLLLDMAEVQFIDSTGIGVLLGRYREIKSQGGELVLINLDKNIRRLLKLSGILNLVDVYENENEAINNQMKEGGNFLAQ